MRSTVITALGLALATAACGSPTATPTAAASPSAPDKPAFAVEGPAVIAAIQALGAPWNAAKTSDPMVDARTAGTVRVLNGAAGSAQVFSRSNGQVWQVKLVTGAANACGASQPLLDALPTMAALLKPGTTVSDADRDLVNDGLIATRRTTIDTPAMAITTQGGCTHWLTLAVPNDAAAA